MLDVEMLLTPDVFKTRKMPPLLSLCLYCTVESQKNHLYTTLSWF